MIDLLSIKDPSFIKELSIKELKELANSIREFLIDNISKTGGHLSSNLGVVEIILAMYYVFDYEKDKFIFDVGHQSYVHKILTGRAKDFETLRQFNGMSGYINKEESPYDIWESGHSSTSISAMTGLIVSNDNPDSRIVSLIGDSSIMNGVAFEGLNILGQMSDKTPIIILNDNKMGISNSVGAMARLFSKLRGTGFVRGIKKAGIKCLPSFLTKWFHQLKRGLKGFIQQDNIFEDLGYDYFGPYDGNDIAYCIKVLSKVKESKQPVIVHLHTKKGKGYEHSENDKLGKYHGVSPFDKTTGIQYNKLNENEYTYSQVVANYLCEHRKLEQFYLIDPAMKSGAKLDEFAKTYPNDFYEVGIAEEHAAVMSAGIALNNKKVVLLMYSTFSQRAYDYILNDISRQNLKVIIGLDRAGIVGEDGSTHQGIYDIPMLMHMPNIKILIPKDGMETIGLFNYAFNNLDSPIVIRYPKLTTIINNFDYNYTADINWEYLSEGNKINIISYGPDVIRLKEVVTNNNISANIVNARCIKPIDTETLDAIFSNGLPILIVEQTVNNGTLYHKVLEHKEINNYKSKVYNYGINTDTIIKHGNINDVYDHYGLSNDKLLNLIMDVLNNDN